MEVKFLRLEDGRLAGVEFAWSGGLDKDVLRFIQEIVKSLEGDSWEVGLNYWQRDLVRGPFRAVRVYRYSDLAAEYEREEEV